MVLAMSGGVRNNEFSNLKTTNSFFVERIGAEMPLALGMNPILFNNYQ